VHHERSNNPGQAKVNEKVIDTFVNHLLVVDFDAAAANCYGEIRSLFKEKGIVVSNMDLLIGSHATSLETTLVTNNMKEFVHFPNLQLENWL
jgi:tRNA(fMet)-specific endonuclease VapC